MRLQHAQLAASELLTDEPRRKEAKDGECHLNRNGLALLRLASIRLMVDAAYDGDP
jgi:hypothetical protein